MLVLARKPGQKLIMTGPDGQPMTLTVLDVRGELVKIGIDAPRSVSIYREEIYLELVEANRSALGNPDAPATDAPPESGNDTLNIALTRMSEAAIVLPKKPKGMGLSGIKR